MGQQQLLLLVIGVILVGFAVLAAFPVLERGFRQDEADGLLDRALAISTHAVAWKARMDPYNGGNQSYAGLATGGLETLALDSSTVRGRFAVTGATATTLEVSGVSARYPDIGVRVHVTGYEVTSSDVSFDGEITIP
jgi:hypothetical protein